MRLLGRISEDEMIAVFLRGELESERFGEKLGAMLGGRDLDDLDEHSRRALLEEHRAYESRDGLFGGFPQRVEWFHAALTRDEVLDILCLRAVPRPRPERAGTSRRHLGRDAELVPVLAVPGVRPRTWPELTCPS